MLKYELKLRSLIRAHEEYFYQRWLAKRQAT